MSASLITKQFIYQNVDNLSTFSIVFVSVTTETFSKLEY